MRVTFFTFGEKEKLQISKGKKRIDSVVLDWTEGVSLNSWFLIYILMDRQRNIDMCTCID